MKNYLIVINPTAGKRNNAGKIEQVKSFFKKQDIPFSLLLTSQEVRADQLVKQQFSPRFSHLVMGGGDGTINEAINGLNDFDRPIGIIPMGSGNDFAKNLILDENLDYLVGDLTMDITVGVSNERRFVNGLGAGFDGQIVLNMMNNRSILKGHLAYLYHVIKILGTYKEREVKYVIDGKSYVDKILLILVANGTTFGGGFSLAPDAHVENDYLDVCIIKQVSPFRRFLNLNRLKSGTHGKLPEVSFHKAKSIRVVSPNINGQIDGEFYGKPPFNISIEHSKLRVLVSRKG